MKKNGVKPAGYLPRIVDDEVEECLQTFGAIEISGTRWCGKTWTARQHAASIYYVDRGQNAEIAKADPASILAGEKPRVIDEWQAVPTLWNEVRHGVDDAGRTRGLWILTGSSTPSTDVNRHSGAGRIGRVRMLPMSLQESGDSTGAISLADLFDGKTVHATSDIDIMKLAELCCRGGWPEAVDLNTSRALRIAHEYVEATVTQSIPSQGYNGDIARRLLRSLARNLGQAATYKVLEKDVYGEDVGPRQSSTTTARYLAMLESLFMLIPVRGWEPPVRSPRRLQTKERRYLADPSLAVALLDRNAESLLEDWQTFGLVFENLCMRDLEVYARALPQAAADPVHYYRDDNGLEVDAVVEDASGRWGAFEIKLSQAEVDEAAQHLIRMRNKVLSNAASKIEPPKFLAVLVGVCERAYQREDGVYVIPIGCLGR
jgi:predicted AAA+ superfamily ATPase